MKQGVVRLSDLGLDVLAFFSPGYPRVPFDMLKGGLIGNHVSMEAAQVATKKLHCMVNDWNNLLWKSCFAANRRRIISNSQGVIRFSPDLGQGLVDGLPRSYTVQAPVTTCGSSPFRGR